MKKIYIKKFTAIFTAVALLVSGLVFSSSVFAAYDEYGYENEIEIEDESEKKSPYEKKLEFYYDFFEEYVNMKEDEETDPDDLESIYKCLVTAYKFMESYRLSLEAKAREAYEAAMETYKAKKEVYDNFDWESYYVAAREYEEEYTEYIRLDDRTKRSLKNRSEDGRRIAFYSSPAAIEDMKDLSKIKGKVYSAKTKNIDMGKGVVITFEDNKIVIESDGTEGVFGIYDIYFMSEDVVYHLLVNITNKGTFTISLKTNKGVNLDIDDIIINQDTQTKLDTPPVSPKSPPAPGSMPSASDFGIGGFDYPAYPIAPDTP